MASAPNDRGGQSVDLTALTTAQLSQIKKQLDDELQHLTSSYQSLRQAQLKFRDCLKSIAAGLSTPPPTTTTTTTTTTAAASPKPILVPLTSSLYVPGALASTATVVVDVGTGFYVEKSAAAARAFYDGKVAALDASLKDLEAVLQAKSGNVRVVEDVLRQKVLGGGAAAAGTAAAAA